MALLVKKKKNASKAKKIGKTDLKKKNEKRKEKRNRSEEKREGPSEEFGSYLLTDETFHKLNEHNQAQLPTGDAIVSQATDKMIYALPEDVTIVIPAYNEADNIIPLCEKLKRMNARVILVDDGSEDRTGKIAKRFGFTVIRHLTNKGKGAAIKSGIRAAQTEKIVLIDADNQHDPHEICALLKELENSDLVVGDRFSKKADLPAHRGIANALIRNLLKTKTGINDPLCGFRAFKKSRIAIQQDGFNADVEMIFSAVDNGARVTQVPISVNYDINEKSSSKTSNVLSGAREYAKLFLHSLAWSLKR